MAVLSFFMGKSYVLGFGASAGLSFHFGSGVLITLASNASRLVPSMDATAARTFATLTNSLYSRGIQVSPDHVIMT